MPHKKISKLPLWAKFLLATLSITLMLIGWFVYKIFTYQQPHFFPLNNLDGEYTVTFECPHGQGWIEWAETDGSAYCIEYRGNRVFSSDGNANFFRITVGNSKVDLESLIGEKIIVTEGDFVSSSEQCVQDKCIDVGGPLVVLDIEEIQVLE